MKAEELNLEGCLRLVEEVYASASSEYTILCTAYVRCRDEGHKRAYQSRMRTLEKFFLDSPLMCVLPVTGESVIDTLRIRSGYSISYTEEQELAKEQARQKRRDLKGRSKRHEN